MHDRANYTTVHQNVYSMNIQDHSEIAVDDKLFLNSLFVFATASCWLRNESRWRFFSISAREFNLFSGFQGFEILELITEKLIIK